MEAQTQPFESAKASNKFWRMKYSFWTAKLQVAEAENGSYTLDIRPDIEEIQGKSGCI